jgi:hypothetical protein
MRTTSGLRRSLQAFAAALLLCVSQVCPAWTLIYSGSAGAASSANVTGNTVGANLCVAALGYWGNGVGPGTVTDDEGNTWTALTEYTNSNEASDVRLFYSQGLVTSSAHTFTSTAATASISVECWSGARASPLDQSTGSGSDAVTTKAPGSLTPSEDGALVISALGVYASPATGYAATGGFTVTGTAWNASWNGGAIGHLVQTTAAAANPTWSWGGANGHAAVALAVFLPAFESPYTDNFNRANGALGSPWTYGHDADTFAIISNSVSAATGGFPHVYYNSTTADDQYSEADIYQGKSAVGVRMGASHTGYYFTVTPTNWILRKGGAESEAGGSSLDAGLHTITPGERLRIEAEGTTIRGYIDDVLIVTATDATYTSGFAGFASTLANFDPYVDSWAGGDLEAANDDTYFQNNLMNRR